MRFPVVAGPSPGGTTSPKEGADFGHDQSCRHEIRLRQWYVLARTGIWVPPTKPEAAFQGHHSGILPRISTDFTKARAGLRILRRRRQHFLSIGLPL
jgi:hypothetical protein